MEVLKLEYDAASAAMVVTIPRMMLAENGVDLVPVAGGPNPVVRLTLDELDELSPKVSDAFHVVLDTLEDVARAKHEGEVATPANVVAAAAAVAREREELERTKAAMAAESAALDTAIAAKRAELAALKGGA